MHLTLNEHLQKINKKQTLSNEKILPEQISSSIQPVNAINNSKEPLTKDSPQSDQLVFVTMSFDREGKSIYSPNTNGATNLHSTASADKNNPKSSQSFSTSSFVALLRYECDEIGARIDPSVKVHVYAPDSPGSITNDGIKCFLYNVSLYGKEKSVIEIEHQIRKNPLFLSQISLQFPIPLDLWFSSSYSSSPHVTNNRPTINGETPIKKLIEEISAKQDVEICITEPIISTPASVVDGKSSVNTFSLPSLKITGNKRNVYRAKTSLSVAIDRLCGYFVDDMYEIPGVKYLPLFVGPGNKFLVDTSIYYQSKIQPQQLERIFFSEENNQDTKSNTSFKFHLTCKTAAGLVQLTKYLDKELSQKTCNLTSRSFTCNAKKLAHLLSEEKDVLEKILIKRGVSIQIEHSSTINKRSHKSTVTLYGVHVYLIEQAIKEITALLYEYHECYLTMEKSFINNRKGNLKEFDSFEGLSSKLRLISQRTGCEIQCSCDFIYLFGREISLIEALSYLKKVIIVAVNLKECLFLSERLPSLKEFICGKKYGKINKIIKETDTCIELVEMSENCLCVTTMSSCIQPVIDGVKMLAGELPAEISFFIPEIHHKRIIGHGGKNIQRIMKKYGVYIKFLNYEECLIEHGHPSVTAMANSFKILPNVVVKTPSKNEKVLLEMKDEVLLEANEHSIDFVNEEIIELQVTLDCFLSDKWCSELVSLMKECSLDYFFSFSTANLILVGKRERLDALLKFNGLSRLSMADYIVFSDTNNYQPILNQFKSAVFIPICNCYYLKGYTGQLMESVGDTANFRWSSSVDFKLTSKKIEKEPLVASTSFLCSENRSFLYFDAALFSNTSSIDLQNNQQYHQINTKNNPSSASIIKPPPGFIDGLKRKHFTGNSLFSPSNWCTEILGDCNKDELHLSANASQIDPPHPILLPTKSATTLEHFLTSLSLERYVEVFERNEIDFSSLNTLTDVDLKEIGIQALGPRKKILQAIQTTHNSILPVNLSSSKLQLEFDGILNNCNPKLSANNLFSQNELTFF